MWRLSACCSLQHSPIVTIPPASTTGGIISNSNVSSQPAAAVAQVVALGRLSGSTNVTPAMWTSASFSVLKSLPKLRGEDIATVLKQFKGPRDLLLLTAICECIKYLGRSPAGLLRSRDIAAIVESFHRLNFVPSAEVLNVLARQVKVDLQMYRVRNIDACKLFRYFSILQGRSGLCVEYGAKFLHPEIVSTLLAHVREKMGTFGATELCIIVKHAHSVSLEELMVNFARIENVPEKTRMYFFSQLDSRFGKDVWKQFYYLMRPYDGAVNNLGWTNRVTNDSFYSSDDEDDLWSSENAIEKSIDSRNTYALFQLEDGKVNEVLRGVERMRRTKSLSDRNSDRDESDHPRISLQSRDISAEQLEALFEFEKEMGLVRRAPTDKEHTAAFLDRLAQRQARNNEKTEYRSQAPSNTLKIRRRFSSEKRNRLMKFLRLAETKIL